MNTTANPAPVKPAFGPAQAHVLAAALETFGKMLDSEVIRAELFYYGNSRVHMGNAGFRRLFTTYWLEDRGRGSYPFQACAQIGRTVFYALIEADQVPEWRAAASPAPQEATA
jgi:hypothetical protein